MSVSSRFSVLKNVRLKYGFSKKEAILNQTKTFDFGRVPWQKRSINNSDFFERALTGVR